MIDFGLSASFLKYHGNTHIDMGKMNGLIGSLHYLSVNCHRRIELSRRDDLESLVYLLIHMCMGDLPWKYKITCLRKELKKIELMKENFD